MKVLYFGTYERDYPRNSQVIAALRDADVEVVERHVSVWDHQRHKLSVGLRGIGRLARAEARLAWGPSPDADVVLVGYPGHLDMWAAGRIAGPRPIVFNPLVSLEDTMVGDRGVVASRSPKARLLRQLDRYAFRAADLIVADTAAHARWFGEQFELDEDRIAVCFASTDDRRFTPGWHPPDEFHCFFWGKMIPLHGMETILEAARRAPEIRFRIAGTGQLDGLLREDIPSNVDWAGWIDHEQLPGEIRTAGCALGIFGTTAKAERVIPNKAFEAIACGAPLVTGDTAAARELLEDERDALLVPTGDPDALASAIRRLAHDPELQVRLAAGGRATYVARATEHVLGRHWRSLLERLMSKSGRGAGTAD